MSTPRSKERLSVPMVGGSSLLIIFAVLCLTIFTLLALSTVQADRRLSESSIRAVTEYYQADCQAEQIFARLRAGQIPEGVIQERSSDSSSQTIFFKYFCPISDTQQLEVTLSQEDNMWTVHRWEAVSTTEY